MDRQQRRWSPGHLVVASATASTIDGSSSTTRIRWGAGVSRLALTIPWCHCFL
jgi:hypothetical protein